MNMNDYQAAAMSTKIYGPDQALDYAILGLAGEAGELAGSYAKAVRDEHPYILPSRKQHLLKEAGDVLWMIAAVADALGTDLEDIAQANLDKLASRANRGKLNGSGDDR